MVRFYQSKDHPLFFPDGPDAYWQIRVEGGLEELILIHGAIKDRPYVCRRRGYAINEEPFDNWIANRDLGGDLLPGHTRFPSDSPWPYQFLVVVSSDEAAMLLKLYGAKEYQDKNDRPFY